MTETQPKICTRCSERTAVGKSYCRECRKLYNYLCKNHKKQNFSKAQTYKGIDYPEKVKKPRAEYRSRSDSSSWGTEKEKWAALNARHKEFVAKHGSIYFDGKGHRTKEELEQHRREKL